MNRKLSFVLLLASMLTSMTVCAQKQQMETDAEAIANQITRISAYDNDGWGNTPDSWNKQEMLKETASNDELFKIAQTHKNAAARAFSFQVLVARGDHRWRDILYQSLQDTSRFSLRSFDIGFGSNVASYEVNVLVRHTGFMSVADSLKNDSIFRNNPDIVIYAPHLYKTFMNTPTTRTFKRIFTTKDSITLDSVIFFTPNMGHISHLYTIIDKLPLDDIHYNRLHSMFYDEGILKALSPLIKHHRNDDKKAVIECLLEYLQDGHISRTNEGLSAVAVWPDSDFIPSLLKLRDYEVKRTLFNYQRIKRFYLALMAYDDDQSYRIIKETLQMLEEGTSVQKYHIRYFHEAYNELLNKRYRPLTRQFPLPK